MSETALGHGLLLAGLLFLVGLLGILTRKNLLFILISIEIMLNAAGLVFIVAGARWGQADGQAMFLFVLSAAAAEVAVGLALALRFFHEHKTLDADAASSMRG